MMNGCLCHGRTKGASTQIAHHQVKRCRRHKMCQSSLTYMTNLKRNSGRWTDARYKSFIVSALRAASRRWPPKFETLHEAYVGQKTNPKTKRISKHYQCKACSQVFPGKDVQVDHIEPVVSTSEGFTTWDAFIQRLFCEKEGLQVLCTPCHNIKTQKEKDASKERTRN